MHAARMPSICGQFKLRFLFYLLAIPAIVVLSLYSFKLPKISLWSQQLSQCACEKCVRDNSVFDEIVKASPAPFLSINYTVTENAFNWWKRLQYTSQNYIYFKMTMDKLFRIFPPSQKFKEPSPGHCRTCAVVGNSGSLAGSHYGPLIDLHDIVIRMNGGRTKGFEAHVGTKTTHHAMYPESAINLDNTTHLVFLPFKMKDLEWLLNKFNPDRENNAQNRPNKDLVMILNPAFLKYVQEVWLKNRGSHPSTGFIVVALSLVLCDEVSVFGFGADRDGNWNHYYEPTRSKWKTGPHAGMVEYQTIEMLHHDKRINFFKAL